MYFYGLFCGILLQMPKQTKASGCKDGENLLSFIYVVESE